MQIHNLVLEVFFKLCFITTNDIEINKLNFLLDVVL